LPLLVVYRPTMDFAPGFKSRLDGGISLAKFAFMGDTFTINTDAFEQLADAEKVNLSIFLILYIFYTVILLILLLNLLIAMMGSTYGEVMESSTLEWRWSYGRRIFRLERCCHGVRPFRWLTGPVQCGNARGVVFVKGDVVHLDWASMTVFDKVTGHSAPVTRIEGGDVEKSMKARRQSRMVRMAGPKKSNQVQSSPVGPADNDGRRRPSEEEEAKEVSRWSRRPRRDEEAATLGVQFITLSQDIEERDGALINLLVHGTPPTPVSFRNKPRYFYDLERGASK